MLKVGLTGGIGCGKTTVSRLFSGYGAPVLDADEISRQLVEPGQPALASIAEAFGERILDCGRLDRAKLREIIFNSSEQKRRLEGILHPLVFAEMRRQMQRFQTPYCILAIPLLVESKHTHFVDRILVIDCSIELQFERVKLRDKLEEGTIARIIASQTSREERVAVADDVIENDGSLDSLQVKVESLHRSYLALSALESFGKSTQSSRWGTAD